MAAVACLVGLEGAGERALHEPVAEDLPGVYAVVREAEDVEVAVVAYMLAAQGFLEEGGDVFEKDGRDVELAGAVCRADEDLDGAGDGELSVFVSKRI